jgi:hypothetical protein
LWSPTSMNNGARLTREFLAGATLNHVPYPNRWKFQLRDRSMFGGATLNHVPYPNRWKFQLRDRSMFGVPFNRDHVHAILQGLFITVACQRVAVLD